jgi:large subunit ribosomal protein L19
MKNAIIANFEKKKFPETSGLPEFRPGDTVRVHYKLSEGSDASKFRIQQYEGVVIAYKKGGPESSFTVRKMGANSIGVERVFPAYSAQIAKVEVVAAGVVRRSRLYYLRDLTGKAARIRSRYVPVKKDV